MPRPQSRTDGQILKATKTVLLERGPAAPLSAIAQRLGLSSAAIIGRFGTRRALVLAALEPPSPHAVMARLYAQPNPNNFSVQLEQLAHELGDWYRRALPLLLLERMAPPAQRRRRGTPPSQVRMHHTLAIWLARGQALGQIVPGDSHVLASTLLCAVQGWALTETLLAQDHALGLDSLAGQVTLLLRPTSAR